MNLQEFHYDNLQGFQEDVEEIPFVFDDDRVSSINCFVFQKLIIADQGILEGENEELDLQLRGSRAGSVFDKAARVTSSAQGDLGGFE